MQNQFYQLVLNIRHENIVRTCALYETDACFQGHYPLGVESSAFKTVRQQIGLYQTFGIAACSSLNYGMYRIAAVRNEESRSRKAVKSLVSRGAEDIDAVTETYGDNTRPVRRPQ